MTDVRRYFDPESGEYIEPSLAEQAITAEGETPEGESIDRDIAPYRFTRRDASTGQAGVMGTVNPMGISPKLYSPEPGKFGGDFYQDLAKAMGIEEDRAGLLGRLNAGGRSRGYLEQQTPENEQMLFNEQRRAQIEENPFGPTPQNYHDMALYSLYDPKSGEYYTPSLRGEGDGGKGVSATEGVYRALNLMGEEKAREFLNAGDLDDPELVGGLNRLAMQQDAGEGPEGYQTQNKFADWDVSKIRNEARSAGRMGGTLFENILGSVLQMGTAAIQAIMGNAMGVYAAIPAALQFGMQGAATGEWAKAGLQSLGTYGPGIVGGLTAPVPNPVSGSDVALLSNVRNYQMAQGIQSGIAQGAVTGGSDAALMNNVRNFQAAGAGAQPEGALSQAMQFGKDMYQKGRSFMESPAYKTAKGVGESAYGGYKQTMAEKAYMESMRNPQQDAQIRQMAPGLGQNQFAYKRPESEYYDPFEDLTSGQTGVV